MKWALKHLGSEKLSEVYWQSLAEATRVPVYPLAFWTILNPKKMNPTEESPAMPKPFSPEPAPPRQVNRCRCDRCVSLLGCLGWGMWAVCVEWLTGSKRKDTFQGSHERLLKSGMTRKCQNLCRPQIAMNEADGVDFHEEVANERCVVSRLLHAARVSLAMKRILRWKVPSSNGGTSCGQVCWKNTVTDDSREFQIQPLTLIYYNSKAAVIVSNVLAAVAMILFSYEFLPGFWKSPRFGTRPLHFGPWSLLVGFTMFSLVLLFRPPRDLVFLDRICINQENQSDQALTMHILFSICSWFTLNSAFLHLSISTPPFSPLACI